MTLDTQPACTRPPAGYYCTRASDHEGPCAALPVPERQPHEHLTYIYTGPQVENEAAAKAYVAELLRTRRMVTLADFHPTPLVRALGAALARPSATDAKAPSDGLLQLAEFEAHNRALRAAVEAIRDTESRAVAIERIEALLK